MSTPTSISTRAKTADISDLHAEGYDLADLLLTAELMQEPDPDPGEVNMHLVRPREEDEGTVVDLLDCEAERMTDLGNARILVRLTGNDVRWCPSMPGDDGWMIWDGSKWMPDTTRHVYRLADMVAPEWRTRAPMKNTDLTLSKEEEEAQELRKKMLAWADKCESERGYRAMIEMFKSRPRIAVTIESWNADPLLVNTPDATYDLGRGRGYRPRREDLITRMTATGASLDDCPLWRRFVLQIMGGVVSEGKTPTTEEVDAAYADPQNKNAVGLVKFLQRATGYSLTGDASEQCLFIAYGSGGNGKGVFFNTVKAIMGTYATGARVETFVDRKAGGIPNDLAALAGARFVLCSEPEENAELDEGLIKMVTGQDTVTARFLNREFFDYIPQFKLWMMTNHKPKIKGTDNGIWRRMRLIPFEVSIPKEKQDMTLSERLKAEWPAILRWMIQGMKDWRKERLNPPPEVLAASAHYRREMDVLADFLEDRCDVELMATANNVELYASYQEWAKDNGMRPRSQSMLSRSLVSRGFKQASDRSHGRQWEGLRLRIKARTAAIPESKGWRRED